MWFTTNRAVAQIKEIEVTLHFICIIKNVPIMPTSLFVFICAILLSIPNGQISGNTECDISDVNKTYML